MDYRDELQRLHHQLDLANRAIPTIGDRATVERLEGLAVEIKGRLDELRVVVVREETSGVLLSSGRRRVARMGATSNSGCEPKLSRRVTAART